jgi:thiamine-phosphate pyrophosphorylase
MPEPRPERMLDANANRAVEGLRAVEDVARFLLDDAPAAQLAKNLRHAIRQAVPDQVVAWRDTAGDVGTTLTAPGELERARLTDLIRANAARAQEALRAAEEAAKLLGLAVCAATLEHTRYETYRLESAVLSRLPAWLCHRIRLCCLVDTGLCADPVAVAGAAARGGAGLIQLRAKGLGQRDYLDLAQRVQAAVRTAGALFAVNDHAAVARALGADALHLGQDDLPFAAARAVVGPRCAIGISAHTPEQARQAVAEGADYLGLGPMFATATKPHEPERGPGLLDAVRPWLTRPSYAIGGLDEPRILDLRPRLPHGVAVAGAICRAADPERAAAEILAVLQPDEMP